MLPLAQLLRHRSLSARHQDGASIIEFAIVAPVLFLFLIGIIEFSMLMFTNSVLEGATNIGSRIGKTGYFAGTSREEYIRNQINILSGGYLDPTKLNISILSYDNFDNIGKPEPCITQTCGSGVWGVDYVDINGNHQWDEDMGRSSAGGRGAVVLYRVTYPWTIFTPMMQQFLGRNFTLTAVATVKNEPF